MSTKDKEDKFEIDVYPKRDIVITEGKNCRLYDENGKEYIDCAANVSVSNIGHGNESVAKALFDQYKRLGNCYSIFYNDVRANMEEKLVEITPDGLNKVFLCNSGSEAVEAAIKFARASTGKKEIIAAMRGFHGKTMGALSATWGRKYQAPFKPLIPGVKHVPFDKFKKLQEQITDDTAAVLLELVQGEGGVRPGSKEYFQKVRRLCDEKDILLIIDEVQTAFGRTGKMFACEHYVVPDIMCVAKSLAGGVPMGATICKSNVKVPKKSHTSTFGGNPLCCAASLAVLEFIEKNNLVQKTAENGKYFIKRLRELDSNKIREVRGLGLMIGIELKEKASPYVQQLMEKGVIALLAGGLVIRLLPPLIITREEIDIVLEKLEEVLC